MLLQVEEEPKEEPPQEPEELPLDLQASVATLYAPSPVTDVGLGGLEATLPLPPTPEGAAAQGQGPGRSGCSYRTWPLAHFPVSNVAR